ncbi:MAG: YidC/Oxa1 family insertase periplasmic-domain containing protein [Verrucomicrobiota bacterium]
MNKQTFPIVIACLVALFGVQYAVNKIYPPIPRKAARPIPAAPVFTTNVVETIQTAQAPVPVATGTRPAERVVTLSNDCVRVEVTSWGGGIKSVELLKYKATLSGPALTLPGDDVFAIEQTDARTVVLRGGGVMRTLTLGADYRLTGKFVVPAGMTNLFITVGTAAPNAAKEEASYLNVDWQGGPKFSNRDVSKVIKRTKTGENREFIHAQWVGVKNQFFTTILSSSNYIASVTYAPVGLPQWKDQPKSENTNGVTAFAEVPVTGTMCEFSYYAGPKEYDRLQSLGQNQEEAMDFGSWMDAYSGFFGWLLLRSLNFFHALIPSYAIAILLVTAALKLAFWPIQAKSIQSMKAMQKFQPQVQKLKDKFKDDPARLNQETMRLYKEHKINPFSGCLPMLVQMPVLIAFYKVLGGNVALRGESFLWIKDLAQPDTIYTLPFALPLLGLLPINPLPILMVGSMIWQQKITPQTGDPQQAKLMMFMPLIMLMFFYNVASGLTLYWTLQQFLSILQQWLSLRKDHQLAPVVVKSK